MMLRKKKSDNAVTTSLLLFVVALDHLTKYIARVELQPGVTISFWRDSIRFTLVSNYDGFLGIFSQTSDIFKHWFMTWGVGFCLLVCIIYLFRHNYIRRELHLPLSLLTGGGLSNLLDRLLHDGGVTDFLSIGVESFRTGIFNLADVFILFGSFTLGYILFKKAN